jgi:hypothetical protein
MRRFVRRGCYATLVDPMPRLVSGPAGLARRRDPPLHMHRGAGTSSAPESGGGLRPEPVGHPQRGHPRTRRRAVRLLGRYRHGLTDPLPLRPPVISRTGRPRSGGPRNGTDREQHGRYWRAASSVMILPDRGPPRVCFTAPNTVPAARPGCCAARCRQHDTTRVRDTIDSPPRSQTAREQVFMVHPRGVSHPVRSWLR